MFRLRLYYVYILTNTYHTVFYTGVTNNLARRCFEHKNKINKGFTSKYNIHKLIYYETFTSILNAIHREKQLKRYTRERKAGLINKFNKSWEDLYIDGRVLKP
jgi:putative endonuclease